MKLSEILRVATLAGAALLATPAMAEDNEMPPHCSAPIADLVADAKLKGTVPSTCYNGVVGLAEFKKNSDGTIGVRQHTDNAGILTFNL